jgi:hypothetical protein
MSFKLLLNDHLLLSNAWACRTFWQKLRGFMFYAGTPDRTLVLSGTKQVHMFFVPFPLAVLVLDKARTVIDKLVLRPWTVSKYYRDAYYFVETPALEKFASVGVGMRLRFEE